MSADLHCHTIISDGSVSIDELVLIAQRKKIKTIAITDHDTFAGVTRAKISGNKYGVEVIDGCEISAYDFKRERKVHILAYMCEYPNRLMGLFKKTFESRKKASTISLQKVSAIYSIPPEMVVKRAQGSTNIFKKHIIQALVDAGYYDNKSGDMYKKLFNSKNGLAKADIEYPNVFDVIDLIHDSGGVAVMAHPEVYDSYDLLEELAIYGLDGVERFYPRANPEKDEYIVSIAKKHNLIMTGGTDFHGGAGINSNPLGTSTCDDSVINEIRKCRVKYIQ